MEHAEQHQPVINVRNARFFDAVEIIRYAFVHSLTFTKILEKMIFYTAIFLLFVWIYLHVTYVQTSNSSSSICLENIISSYNITQEDRVIKVYVEGIIDQFANSNEIISNITLIEPNKEKEEHWLTPLLYMLNGEYYCSIFLIF
jgi:flagellar biogenesis protein FliO